MAVTMALHLGDGRRRMEKRRYLVERWFDGQEDLDERGVMGEEED